MAQQSNNVINNYKGVMLCSRPNQKKSIETQKPFCGRVVPGELLGLNPVKNQHALDQSPIKKNVGVLNKHKKWLNEFKEKVHLTKAQIQQKEKKQEQKFKRIRQQAEADRQRARKMKEQYNQAATKVMSVLQDKTPPAPTGEITAENLRRLDAANEKGDKGDFKKKKQEKPAWAMTKQAAEQNEQEEVDELLNFFEQNHVSDFSQDTQIKNLLSQLKDKIQNMKQDQDWKEKEAERIKKNREAKKEQGDDDDKYSNFTGGQSQGKSVASQKTQKKIEELRAKKKEQQEWDKFTTSQKSAVDIEERIAKNLADEVLRNYPGLKGVHSNVSIRKLLEVEAAKVMNEPIIRPVISTIVKQKQPINANTLPYLHRNPAI